MLFSKQMSLIKEIAKSEYRAESWLGNSEFTYKGSYGHNVGDSLAGSRKLALKIWTSVSSLLPELIVLPVLFLGVLQLTFSHTIFSYIRLIQIVHKVYIYARPLIWSRHPHRTNALWLWNSKEAWSSLWCWRQKNHYVLPCYSKW